MLGAAATSTGPCKIDWSACLMNQVVQLGGATVCTDITQTEVFLAVWSSQRVRPATKWSHKRVRPTTAPCFLP